jgi:hypothetical protein
MSERSQRYLVWWALAFTAIYGATLGLLLDMIPPPTAQLSANEIAEWYSSNHDQVRIGALIAGWTSAFMIPLVAVIVVQMARQEPGRKVWSVLCALGGAMMSLFLVLPPLFWGVAAFTEDRSPEVTSLMHELGTLTLVTTDQYYIFMWVAIVVICFLPTSVTNSPFPRWFGYFTLWSAIMFEAGVFAFLPRTGPFAWNGLLVYWSPLTIFGLWIGLMSFLLLKALRAQQEEAERTQGMEPEPVAATT